MLYPVCPTCGHLLADIEVEFTYKYEKINESKDSDEKKGKEIEKLFVEVKIKKYCCKMRLISYFNHIRTIL
jgi:DNA-directed RNA polymerase subunit N (RpoN/RPB10)